MRKLIFFTLLLLLITPCLRAQRQELSQARSYIKSGKNLDKAEKLMTDLLVKDSANRRNPKIYEVWYQAIKAQYDIQNEKLYLNQKTDTAEIYLLTNRMLDVLLKLDSVDVLPNEKGKVKPKYRKKNSKAMDDLRPNLYYGGLFFINKSDFSKAFTLFDKYISCKDLPFFAAFDYSNNDEKIVEAAYWATYSAYKLSDADKTLKYSDMAMEDTSRYKAVLIYKSEAFIKKKDELQLLDVLNDGFEKYPLDPYFFPRLMDYHIMKDQKGSALEIVNNALKSAPRNELFLFAKSSLLLNMERFNDCISVSDTLISINPNNAESYFNAGISYFNQVGLLEQSDAESAEYASSKERKRLMAEKKEKTLELYRKAKPYLEKYRSLAPNSPNKWAPALYNIYLNLNMGKQFDEIDAILKKKR